jgi:hypothetical protein
LQNDHVTIAGHEVEPRDLNSAANYAMDCIAVQVEGEEPKFVVDRLIGIPDRLLTLLKATSLAATTDALVRVKSHYSNVDMTKVKGVLMLRKTSRPWSLKFEMSPWRRWIPWIMKVTMAGSSLGLGTVPPPPLSHIKSAT